MARKKLLALIILILVFAAISVTAILLLGSPDEPREDSLIVVAEISPNDVDSMTVMREDSEVVLIKQGGIWQYAEDQQVPIDQLLTESALTQLSYVYADEIVFEQISDPSVYGLDPAALSVTLHLNDGDTWTYRFGIPSTDQQSVYMQLQGHPQLYRFDMVKYKQIVAGLEGVVNLSLDIDARSLSAFSLTWPARNDRMAFEQIPDSERSGTEVWRLTAPFEAIANPAAIQLVEALFTPARLAGYLSEEMEPDYGIDENSATLTLIDQQGNQVTLTIGNALPDGNYACTVSGRSGVYIAYQGIEALLKMDITEAVYTQVFPVSEQILPSFTLSAENMSYRLINQDAQYTLNGNELTRNEVEAIIGIMQFITLDGPVVQAPIGTAHAAFTMGNIQLQFYSYQREFFAVSMGDNPFGYIRMDKLARLIDQMDQLIQNKEDERTRSQ